MTDWKLVYGSQIERPLEIDLATSPHVVYQRKNIKRVTVDSEDGSTELWQYDERTMSHEEYSDLRIDQNRADIDYMSMELNVPL